MAPNDLLQYFIKHTNERFDAIEKKLDRVLVFQAQVKTAVKLGHVVVGFISSAVSTALTLFITKG